MRVVLGNQTRSHQALPQLGGALLLGHLIRLLCHGRSRRRAAFGAGCCLDALAPEFAAGVMFFGSVIPIRSPFSSYSATQSSPGLALVISARVTGRMVLRGAVAMTVLTVSFGRWC